MSSSSFSAAPKAETLERKINVFGQKMLLPQTETGALYRLNPLKPGSFPPTVLPGKKVPIFVNG
jgi:hypothetical protein